DLGSREWLSAGVFCCSGRQPCLSNSGSKWNAWYPASLKLHFDPEFLPRDFTPSGVNERTWRARSIAKPKFTRRCSEIEEADYCLQIVPVSSATRKLDDQDRKVPIQTLTAVARAQPVIRNIFWVHCLPRRAKFAQEDKKAVISLLGPTSIAAP